MTNRMQIPVPTLAAERQAVDIETSLMGVSGIKAVQADTTRHLLTIEFDPAHASRKYIEQIIKKSGYPIEANGN